MGRNDCCILLFFLHNLIYRFGFSHLFRTQLVSYSANRAFRAALFSSVYCYYIFKVNFGLKISYLVVAVFVLVFLRLPSNRIEPNWTESIGLWIQKISQMNCSLHLFSLRMIYGLPALLYLNFCAKNQTQMKNDRNHIADYVFKYVSITCYIFLQAMLTRRVHQFSSVVLLCLYLQDEN